MLSTKKEDDGSRIITFKDEEGIKCSVCDERHRGEWGNVWYITEHDYPKKYYAAHPELFDGFNDEGHNFDIEDYTMCFDSFDEIDTATEYKIQGIYTFYGVYAFFV